MANYRLVCCYYFPIEETFMFKKQVRHEASMLQKLSIILLNSAPQITHYDFKLCSKLLILANNVSL